MGMRKKNISDKTFNGPKKLPNSDTAVMVLKPKRRKAKRK
jgi:hypothetical protein